jgi:hypothetical protein
MDFPVVLLAASAQRASAVGDGAAARIGDPGVIDAVGCVLHTRGMSQNAASSTERLPVTPTWVPPYGWPDAPEGWAPTKGWRPPAALPLPAGHTWWAAELAHEDGETRRLVQPVLYLEAMPSWWDEASAMSEMPSVWTPPPTWPPAPDGFEPPVGWVAPAAWGPAPDGWVFRQPDPAVYEPWRAERDQFAEHNDTVLKTPSGLIGLLNYLERRLAYSVTVTARLTPTELRASAGTQVSFTTAFHDQLDQHADRVAAAAGELRDYVLGCLRLGAAPNGAFLPLRQALGWATEALGRDVHMAIGSVQAEGEDGNNTRAILLARALDALAAEHLSGFTPGYPPNDHLSEDIGANNPPWVVAEELTAAWLQEHGFPDAQRTPPGADGGFDVEARGLVVQVKHRTKPSGREEIQRLVGANLHGASMAFFSTAGYTAQAVQYAQAAGVALYVLDLSSAHAELLTEG